MSKALFGFMGEPRAYMLLRQIGELQARVAELEEALRQAEAEISTLRAEDERHDVEVLA